MTTQKPFRLRITQSGTSDPTISVLLNDTGITLTPTRTGVGSYVLTADKSFLDMYSVNDNSILLSATSGTTYILNVSVASATEIDVQTRDLTTNALTDELLNNVFIEMWLKVDASVTNTINTSISDPTTDDIPDGQWGVWDNTTTGYTKLWCNVGGQLASLAFNYADQSITEIVGGRPRHLA